MTFMASHRPEKVAQLGRRIFGANSPAVINPAASSNSKGTAPQIVTSANDKEAALQTVDALRSFFKSLGLPLTLSDLGITNPDIATLTRKFHENKGLPFGPYYPLHPIDTAAIYRLMQ
jgi:hypothetical protein